MMGPVSLLLFSPMHAAAASSAGIGQPTGFACCHPGAHGEPRSGSEF